jgi:hypothetical protein
MYLGGDQAPLLSSYGWTYSDGPRSYLFQMATTVPGSLGLYPASIGVYGPEGPDSVGGFPSNPD